MGALTPNPKLPVVFAALALALGAASAASAVPVALNGVPDKITLPLADGTNAVVTASIPAGVTGGVWLSPDGPQEVRVILQEAADGRYPVNLGDPIIEAVLTAMPRPGAFRIYAETRDGISASMAVRYSVAPQAARIAPRPPTVQGRFRLFVVSPGMRREVGRDVPEMSGLYEDLALLMASGGPGGYPFLDSSSPAFRPEDVDALEIDYRTPSGDAAAHAQVGRRNWSFVGDPDEPRLRLEMNDELREHWLGSGKLAVFVTSDGQQREVAVLEVAPEGLDIPEGGAQFTITQRYTKEVPGSEGYLRVQLGDITAGQVLVTLRAGQTKLIDARSMREGEEAGFSLGERDYVLRLTRLVNVLVGDDFAQFAVSGAGQTDLAVIHGLIRQVEKADLVFVRNGKEYGPRAAAEHLRSKLSFASAEVSTVEDFITKVASRSWTTGEPYTVKLPDGREQTLEECLRDRTGGQE